MKFFIDTANIDDIQSLVQLGLVDGVTTNPSLVARTGGDIKDLLQKICHIVDGPVSAEVTAKDTDQMIIEGRRLASIADNVVIKLPLTWDGLRACGIFKNDGIMVNMTLCFSANQAILAAKAGASFISPFIGRLDDIGFDGMTLIREIRTIYDHYDSFDTQILVASIRSPLHVKSAAMIGADVITAPPAVLKDLITHPLTDKGLQGFLADWAKSGQSIL